MNKYLIAFFSIFLGSVAQMLLKKGSVEYTKINAKILFSVITNKFLLMGLIFYGLSALLWINVLSRMKLSVAYPLVSFGYILTFIFSYFILHEDIYWNQIVGLILIILGIIFITR